MIRPLIIRLTKIVRNGQSKSVHQPRKQFEKSTLKRNVEKFLGKFVYQTIALCNKVSKFAEMRSECKYKTSHKKSVSFNPKKIAMQKPSQFQGKFSNDYHYKSQNHISKFRYQLRHKFYKIYIYRFICLQRLFNCPIVLQTTISLLFE